jgi:hypothetical protein
MLLMKLGWATRDWTIGDEGGKYETVNRRRLVTSGRTTQQDGEDAARMAHIGVAISMNV